jgi:hypothetical protein
MNAGIGNFGSWILKTSSALKSLAIRDTFSARHIDRKGVAVKLDAVGSEGNETSGAEQKEQCGHIKHRPLNS